ncbi:hypothetical protein EX30DRAFT_221267 [Ascodesmis nigricans]|uniref:Uncharacterized protein n=1 Tax=Ascodesmis nigricans TaxID=341454 RepID=A0A4S2MZP3_9PEZI|nr:hypothetical protein EX30DRAFT_221267 [Ascodesmis nigricans]
MCDGSGQGLGVNIILTQAHRVSFPCGCGEDKTRRVGLDWIDWIGYKPHAKRPPPSLERPDNINFSNSAIIIMILHHISLLVIPVLFLLPHLTIAINPLPLLPHATENAKPPQQASLNPRHIFARNICYAPYIYCGAGCCYGHQLCCQSRQCMEPTQHECCRGGNLCWKGNTCCDLETCVGIRREKMGLRADDRWGSMRAGRRAVGVGRR